MCLRVVCHKDVFCGVFGEILSLKNLPGCLVLLQTSFSSLVCLSVLILYFFLFSFLFSSLIPFFSVHCLHLCCLFLSSVNSIFHLTSTFSFFRIRFFFYFYLHLFSYFPFIIFIYLLCSYLLLIVFHFYFLFYLLFYFLFIIFIHLLYTYLLSILSSTFSHLRPPCSLCYHL